MTFESTNLPDTPIMRQAYNVMMNKSAKLNEVEVKSMLKSIDLQIEGEVKRIKAAGPKEISAEEKKAILLEVKNNREKIIQDTFSAQKPQLEAMGKARVTSAIGKAKIVLSVDHPDKEDMAAALLLVPFIHSPMDYMDAKKAVGEKVGAFLLHHTEMNAYPENQQKQLATAADNVKSYMLLYFAIEMTLLNAKMKKDSEIAMVNVEKVIRSFNEAKVLFGKNDVVDEFYSDAFNTLHKTLKTDFTIQKNEQGIFVLDTKGQTSGMLDVPSSKAPQKGPVNNLGKRRPPQGGPKR